MTKRVRSAIAKMHSFAFDALTQKTPWMRPLVNKPQQDPRWYAWNCDNLEWSNDKTIPDVFAMVEDNKMDGVIWFASSLERTFVISSSEV